MSKIHSRYVKNLDNCMALFCLTFEKWMCPKSQFGHLQSDLEIISKLQENVRNMTIICPNFGHIMDTWPATHRTTRATTLSFDSYFSLILLPLLYYSTTCVCSSDANVKKQFRFRQHMILDKTIIYEPHNDYMIPLSLQLPCYRL